MNIEKTPSRVPNLGKILKVVADFVPAGDQPSAINELVDGLEKNEKNQVLLGATGTGKTFTMAKIIERTQSPALILAPNKTLAGREQRSPDCNREKTSAT